ncbi:uncharacterized protein LOC107782173 isoform X3 [Nicotiana tabacum]|uniref:Uncharacterized protein LOC107782173 isoform X3 n=1 Tax=Nicotiana tabacum TaxID=4097 RepID=A0AC58RYK5_TOBAC
MRTLCPNLDNADRLETVLEVPIPEEMFNNMGSNAALQWRNMRNLMRVQSADMYSSSSHHAVVSIGQVKMATWDMHQSGCNTNSKRHCEVGAFVLWQKNPDLWVLELVVSGCKISAGSNRKVAWSQSSSSSNASKGPPRSLRRFFQGLDPRSTTNLFLNAICVGEKTIKDEECFILKLESSIDMLKDEKCFVHHTILGYLSQRTGLLIQFEDTKLVKLKSPRGDSNVFWKISMEAMHEDYSTLKVSTLLTVGRLQQ